MRAGPRIPELTEIAPTGEVSFGIDVLRAAEQRWGGARQEIGITAGEELSRRTHAVAPVAIADGVHVIAAETNQRPVLAGHIEFDWRDREPLLDLRFIVITLALITLALRLQFR